MSARGKVFVYLVKSGTLSSRKLALLVGPDVLHLNFEGPVSSFVHDAYIPSIALCTNLTKLVRTLEVFPFCLGLFFRIYLVVATLLLKRGKLWLSD